MWGWGWGWGLGWGPTPTPPSRTHPGRGDGALGSCGQDPAPDRPVQPGMPGLALPEPVPGPESARGRVLGCSKRGREGREGVE